MDDLVTSQPATYVGTISSKHKSFGFIRSAEVPTDTFFHKSACGPVSFDELAVGDAVSFQLEHTDSKPGKRAASWIARSTEEPMLEHVGETLHYGRVVKLPAAASSCSGVLRFIPAVGKVQHLTFLQGDVSAGTAEARLQLGQPVAFRVLTDQRQQRRHEGNVRASSSHAVHAYTRAVQVAPLSPAEVVSRQPMTPDHAAILLHMCPKRFNPGPMCSCKFEPWV